jgi:hypothetical protein
MIRFMLPSKAAGLLSITATWTSGRLCWMWMEYAGRWIWARRIITVLSRWESACLNAPGFAALADYALYELWHNTLAIDEQLQKVEGFAPITEFVPDQPKPRVVVDMSRVYAGQLNTAMRSVQISADRTTWIHDRVEAADKDCTVRWSMVTPADVEIQSGGTALLKKDGKTLYFAVRVLNAPATYIPLKVWATEPKSKLDEPNRGTRILGFEIPLKAAQTMAFYVTMVPLADGQKEFSSGKYQPAPWPEKVK